MRRLSYRHSPSSLPYQYETINDAIRNNAETMPDTEGFIFYPPNRPRESLSYKEIYNRARRTAHFLVASGVRRQDIVGLFGPNTLERIVAECGILLAGGVVLQLNIDFKNAQDAEEILDKAECKMLFVDPGIDNRLLPIIESLENINDDESQKRQYVFLRESKLSNIDHIFIGDIEIEREEILPQVHPEDNAIIFPTSGTTGKPKMVVHDHQFTFPGGRETVMGVSRHFNDRPFCWIGGAIVSPTVLGTILIFTDTIVGTEDQNTNRIWQIMSTEKVHMATVMPYVMHGLINEMDSILDDGFRLKCMLTGGQIVDKFCTRVIGRFCELLLITYGCTESLMVSVLQVRCMDDMSIGNVGKSADGIEVRIVDTDGYPTPVGVEGEIQLRSHYLMKGYFKNEVSNEAAFTTDRSPWFKTGDIGLLTADDDLYVKGRFHDNISRGGRKISPGVVDDAVGKMDGIRLVATVAVPDARLYEDVCVCYVAGEGFNLQPSDVKRYCENVFVTGRVNDGHGIMPKYFVRFDNFPDTYMGKTDKKMLQIEARKKLQLA